LSQKLAIRRAWRLMRFKAGQRVIIVAGVPLGTPGATNILRIAFVGAEAAGD
jgi:pyruvate kinase